MVHSLLLYVCVEWILPAGVDFHTTLGVVNCGNGMDMRILRDSGRFHIHEEFVGIFTRCSYYALELFLEVNRIPDGRIKK